MSKDVLVVGGGIVGLATAWRLLRAQPGLRLKLLEKEPGLGRHQTGNNSGVLHAGLYYRPGSAKARQAANSPLNNAARSSSPPLLRSCRAWRRSGNAASRMDCRACASLIRTSSGNSNHMPPGSLPCAFRRKVLSIKERWPPGLGNSFNTRAAKSTFARESPSCSRRPRVGRL